MSFEVFSDPVVFEAGPVPVTRTVLTSLAVSGALLGSAAWLGRAGVQRPDSLPGVAAVIFFEWIDGLVREIVGRTSERAVILCGSLFLFILACNLSGRIPGLHPPTANLGATSALAVVVLVSVPAFGIAGHGLGGYLRHYLRPNPLLLPLHLIAEASRTLALSVRLFGNIMSGHLVIALVASLSGFLVPIPLIALDLLIGLLQAYIFAILTAVYIGAAVRSGEE